MVKKTLLYLILKYYKVKTNNITLCNLSKTIFWVLFEILTKSIDDNMLVI